MNTFKKMFLLTTIVLLLAACTAVSAVDTNNVTNDAVYTDATAYSAVNNEQSNEVATVYDSSPEDYIQPGATTTNPESITAVAGDYATISATVDRTIPGARLSEGVVDFNVNNGQIQIINVPLKDGIATAEINIPEEWIGQDINYTASYLGSQSFAPSSGEATITVVRAMLETETSIYPVVGEFNKPINLTATVKTPLLGTLNDGYVYFTTATGIIKDEDGQTLYVPVIGGVATVETIAQESWLDGGDVNTIEATFDGYKEFLPSTSEPTALRLYDKVYNTTTYMVPPIGAYDQPINLTALVVTEENDTVKNGYVHYVIGDKTVTDTEGNVLYAPVDNGVANVETIASRDWEDGGDVFTIHAVYEGVGPYLDSESEDVALTLVERFYNTTTTIAPVVGEFNKPINLTATIKTPLLGTLNDGKVCFRTGTGIILDDEGYTLYAYVNNGVATVETIAKESWLDDGDVNTIEAIFTGYNEFLSSESEPTALRLYDELYKTTTEMIPPRGIYDQPINLTATVNSDDKIVENGYVYFVIGDKTVTDTEGNILYAEVVEGVANIETIASRDWEDGGDVLTIHAVYEGVGPYLDSESEDVALTLVDEFVNTTTTIGPVIGEFNKPITLTATIKSADGSIIGFGEVYFNANGKIIVDEEGEILYAPVVDGEATLETIAQESWIGEGDVNTIEAVFTGMGVYSPSTSESTALRIYEKIYNTTTTMIPPVGVYGEPITFTALVADEDVNPVNNGFVYFVIGDKAVTDEYGNIVYADVVNGVATLETIADRNWHDGGDVFTIYAVYEGVDEYLDSESNPVALTINEPVNPQPVKPVKPVKPVVTKKVSKTFKDTKTTGKAFKVLVKDKVITTGNVITLGDLNNIFNKDFTNGILVVYLDGKVVFNGTTTDDLTLVILQIIESLIGEHELKVEFTDANNETNTYVENITIQ